MTDDAICTHNLTRDFETVRALDNLTMEVPTGIVFGFLGPNGAGKTTTIRLLLGLLEPTCGGAEVLGFDTRTRAEAIRSRTGALLEYPGLYERLSAEDNMEFYGRSWRLSKEQRYQRTKELLTHFGLWDRRREVVGKWSRGMKQKLAVARTLINNPSLVFMDEPTAGLDPMAAATLREDLRVLADEEGVTIFLTTHNLAEAERLCTKVGVVHKGKMLAVGRPDELLVRSEKSRIEVLGSGFNASTLSRLRARPEVAGVDVRDGALSIELSSAETDSAPLVRLIVGSGAKVEEVRRVKANLEDAFMALVRGEGK